MSVSVRRLEQHVDRMLVLRGVDAAAWHRGLEHPKSLDEDAEAERQTCAPTTASEEGLRLTLAAPRDVVRLFRAVLCTLRRAIERETGRLPSEGEGFEAMLDHELRSWGADDPRLARLVRRKYRRPSSATARAIAY